MESENRYGMVFTHVNNHWLHLIYFQTYYMFPLLIFEIVVHVIFPSSHIHLYSRSSPSPNTLTYLLGVHLDNG